MSHGACRDHSRKVQIVPKAGTGTDKVVLQLLVLQGTGKNQEYRVVVSRRDPQIMARGEMVTEGSAPFHFLSHLFSSFSFILTGNVLVIYSCVSNCPPKTFRTLKMTLIYYVIASGGWQSEHVLAGTSSSVSLTVLKVSAQGLWSHPKAQMGQDPPPSHSVVLVGSLVGSWTESLISSLADDQRLPSVPCQVVLSIGAGV